MQPVKTEGAPSSPLYSQAFWIDNELYVSGMLPIDPLTKTLEQGDIIAKTSRVFENIKAILVAAGLTFANVFRVEIFCTDLKRDFEGINAVYKQYFPVEIKPVRQTVQVAALPMDSPIEISCIAWRPAKL